MVLPTPCLHHAHARKRHSGGTRGGSGTLKSLSFLFWKQTLSCVPSPSNGSPVFVRPMNKECSIFLIIGEKLKIRIIFRDVKIIGNSNRSVCKSSYGEHREPHQDVHLLPTVLLCVKNTKLKVSGLAFSRNSVPPQVLYHLCTGALGQAMAGTQDHGHAPMGARLDTKSWPSWQVA